MPTALPPFSASCLVCPCFRRCFYPPSSPRLCSLKILTMLVPWWSTCSSCDPSWGICFSLPSHLRFSTVHTGLRYVSVLLLHHHVRSEYRSWKGPLRPEDSVASETLSFASTLDPKQIPMRLLGQRRSQGPFCPVVISPAVRPLNLCVATALGRTHFFFFFYGRH